MTRKAPGTNSGAFELCTVNDGRWVRLDRGILPKSIQTR
jgi:hypothetical protein